MVGEEPLCCYGSDGCGFRGEGEEPHRGIGTGCCPVQQLVEVGTQMWFR